MNESSNTMEQVVELSEPRELSRVHTGLALSLLGRDPAVFESFCTLLA